VKEISAGGVVFRKQGDQLEIQLIQDRYGKITLPKGKMESGETVEETALREIEEETGIVGEIVKPLERIDYQYEALGQGTINKEVHYYLVEAKSGALKAQVEEIRGVEWFAPDKAWRNQLNSGYDNNNSVLRKALEQLEIEVD
jgi:8-oxo-dGTP pyrophosphatase MutT (NUDIX family)